MADQCTKFEVSRFTPYEAMNGSAKCEKWGGLWWLRGTQGHGQCHHSIERIRLPTHSVHFLITYNILSETCCISSQQANSAIPYASAYAKMHPDGGCGDGGPVPWHNWHCG